MLKNICIYTNYRILGEVRMQTFQQNGSEQKRVSFCLSSYTPDNNGIYLKIYCYAFDKVAEEISKLNLNEGDLLTAVCEHVQYKTSKGVLENRYKVINFNYIKKEKEKNHEQNQNQDSFMNVLNMMFN